MIYCCSTCRYVFERDRQPVRCPDCGKEYIRYATKKEIDEYMSLLHLHVDINVVALYIVYTGTKESIPAIDEIMALME